MGRIVVHLHGRLRDSSMKSLFSTYETRLKSKNIRVEIHHEKTSPIEYYNQICSQEGEKLFLDESGKMYTSLEFSELIGAVSLRPEHLHLCIGPVEGWKSVLKTSDSTVSLSKMTFTHEFASVVLIEQIYRGFEILKGSEYHKV
jgi:23S rRNA (pseudouridine1915-N3)-methyltransferase